MKKNVTVYLVDDHAVVREGYKHLLRKANIEVIAEASSGEEAYQHFNEIKPDVIVMDLSMPGMGGIEAIGKIMAKNKQSKILAFSMHDDLIFSTRAMQAGAKGYVTKASAPSVLVEAVFVIAGNRKYLSQDLANKIAMQQVDIKENLSHLTPREFEVLQLLANGLALDSIAKSLHLDYRTVANIQTRLRQKLNVESGSQLILAAIKHNILQI